LILSVTLVTYIVGRSVRTLPGTPLILNEVLCSFPPGPLDEGHYITLSNQIMHITNSYLSLLYPTTLWGMPFGLFT